MRKIWVSTTAFQRQGGPTVADNIAKAGRLIDQAAADQPDIICLPETFNKEGVTVTDVGEVAERVPGPTTEMAMERARRHSCNIICPLMERRDGTLYNSAVVIDRKGQIAGVYEKLHPVTTTMDFTAFEDGTRPGLKPKVFDLDFGRIGILICFDIQWPCEWAALKDLGAEIVFWPSAYDGGFPLQARAWDHHYWVVSSVQTQKSRIIDITGEILVEAGARTPVVGMEIDLEKRFFHTDFNASQIAAIKGKYGREVTVRLYHDEGGMTVECRSESLTVDALMEEFDLELVPDYVARHETAELATRKGRTPDPQEPRRVPGQWT